MKVISIFTCIVFFFSASAFNANKKYHQTNAIGDSIVATYNYVNKYQTEGILLTLYKNHTYTFSVVIHMLHEMISKGTWGKNGNGFILNSAVQQKEIPITVILSDSTVESEYIKIEDVTNNTGAFLRTVEMMINYDTTKLCYPNIDNDCKIKKQELKSIRLKLENNTTSNWYPINSTVNYSNLKIVVNIDFNPDFYIFFKDKKFIKKGRKLYDSEHNTYFNKGGFKNKKSVRRERNYY